MCATCKKVCVCASLLNKCMCVYARVCVTFKYFYACVMSECVYIYKCSSLTSVSLCLICKQMWDGNMWGGNMWDGNMWVFLFKTVGVNKNCPLLTIFKWMIMSSASVISSILKFYASTDVADVIYSFQFISAYGLQKNSTTVTSHKP